MQEEFQREKEILRAELDQLRKDEIIDLERKHALALEDEIRKRKLVCLIFLCFN